MEGLQGEVWEEVVVRYGGGPEAGLYEAVGRVGQEEEKACVGLGRRWRWLEVLEERVCEGVVGREEVYIASSEVVVGVSES